MPRPVLKHFSRSICSLFHRENWGHQNTSQEFFAFADFGPISSSPSGDLCSFSYVISLQHLNMFKYLPLKNNLKICHNNVLFSGNLLQKYSLNSYLNPFSIISQGSSQCHLLREAHRNHCHEPIRPVLRTILPFKKKKNSLLLFYGGRYAHFTAKDTEGQMALS